MSRRVFFRLAVSILVLNLVGIAADPLRADEDHRHSASKRCTAEYGQRLIDQGKYEQAVRAFTCVIDHQPTEVEGYRGRIEAQLLLGRYSDALRDNARVTAFVIPVYPNAKQSIHDGYAARLATSPNSIPALTGASFARWTSFEYQPSLQILKRLLKVKPNDLYGNLFRGSCRLLGGTATKQGIADLDYALAHAPNSADVRFIVADAYTYGLPDPDRAFFEASLALAWGLDTPRIHAILATSYQAFGDDLAAAEHIYRHIELVTVQYLPTAPLNVGGLLTLGLIPGRTYEIPVPAVAGQALSISTSSVDFYDTIAVLLAPDGTPVVGSDDADFYFAAFEWVAPATGTYLLQVTSFESIDTGNLIVTRD